MLVSLFRDTDPNLCRNNVRFVWDIIRKSNYDNFFIYVTSSQTIMGKARINMELSAFTPQRIYAIRSLRPGYYSYNRKTNELLPISKHSILEEFPISMGKNIIHEYSYNSKDFVLFVKEDRQGGLL